MSNLTAEQNERRNLHLTVIDGKRLRQLRRQRGLSKEELAGRAGISLATVARLERQPHASCLCRTVGRLAAALGQQPLTLVSAASSDSEGNPTPATARDRRGDEHHA